MASSPSALLLRRIVSSLSPHPNGIVGAFAYGSAVFPQHGRPSGTGQIDMVLIVNDPVQWHLANVQRHPHHYNSLMRTASKRSRMLGYLEAILNKWPGPRVYYNPLVQWTDSQTGASLMLKYGVVRVTDVISDLTSWSDLYIAGRLHKPVLWLPTRDADNIRWTGTESGHAALDQAQRKNLLAALSYTILTARPEESSLPESDLFHALASISYQGDWRMIVGEDKNKVTRLVTGTERVSKFRQLYANCLTDQSLSKFISFEPSDPTNRDQFVLRISPSRDDPELLSALLHNLPARLREVAAAAVAAVDRSEPTLASASAAAIRGAISRAVVSTVRRSSVEQTVLGLMSAGPVRSVRYAAAKLHKMFASLGVLKWY